MVIKNSDGTNFKLNGPNPVMKNQKTWNGFILHNMDWNPYVFDGEKQDNNNYVKQEYKDSFLDELEKSSSELKKNTELKDLPHKDVDESKIIKEDINKKPKLNISTNLCYCLPAKEESKTDVLYDEVYKSISYEKPFILEIVITEETDVNFECWTTIKNVDIGSILYPKNKMKRWWKVAKKEFKTGGYLLKCNISEYQPSFDD